MLNRGRKLVSKIICFSMLALLLFPLGGVSHADTEPQDMLYDFESGTAEGWQTGWGDALVSVEASQDLAVTENTYALKVNTSYTNDAQWQTAAIKLIHGLDLKNYAAVDYDVYVPESFEGILGLSTDLNNAWTGLSFNNYDIRALKSSSESINSHNYVKIHEHASIPASASQTELIIQLQKNMTLTYNGAIYIDNIQLTVRADIPPAEPEPPSHAVGTYLAKDAVLAGNGPEFRNEQVGDIPYTGEGYVSFFFGEDAEHPGSAAFHVNAPSTGLYKLIVGYYAPYGEKETSILVNGSPSGNLHLPLPAEGTATNEISAGKVLLQAGANTVGFARNWGYYGIEYIRLESDAPVADRLEAESGEVEGGVTKQTTGGNFSGEGYVSFKDTGALTLTYNAAAAGLYEFAVGYSSPYGYKETAFLINGAANMNIPLEQADDFKEKSVGKVMLNQGENTIRFEPGWGWYNIDYVAITAAAPAKQHHVAKELVNPNATPEARALQSYLVDQYGSKIISGQQSLEDAEWIHEQTGKYPGLVSFDLIDYSPSRVENGTDSHEIEKMMDWASRGGLLALCWHWNAPKGLFGNEAGKEWWRGFYTEFTTFDLKYALEHKDSEDYQLILRDIDAIAVQLKRLQDAHIPVLWRPLHEAEGGWFWWGAKGAGPAKELYRLLYDRLTNVHQLNNLIWVWNSASADWYPGDDVVDIISTDIYNAKGDYSANSNKYDSLVTLVSDKKLVTLPENGPIPDPDQLQLYNADWSWFSTWNGDFIKDGVNNSPEHLNKVFNSDYVLTLDELPSNLSTYGLPETSASLSASPNANGWFNQNVQVTLTATASEPGAIATHYSINGDVNTTYSEPVAIENEGSTTITYFSTDSTDKSESEKTLQIKLDKTAPNVQLLQSNEPVGDVTQGETLHFALTSTDAASGVASEQLLLDGQELSSTQAIDSRSLSIGAHTVQYTVTDAADNVAANSITFNVMKPLAKGAPGKPVLSDNNGQDNGLKDGKYTVTMNMRHGNNGSVFKLYENGVLISTRKLNDASPAAQMIKTEITGKSNGTYTYTCELTNVFGTTACKPHDVVVSDANPGKAVLSNDNWDGDGSYKVTMNMWRGTNAAEYRLYENDQLIDTKTLIEATPQAQSAVTAFSNRAKGTYVYRCDLVNASGITSSKSITIKVIK